MLVQIPSVSDAVDEKGATYKVFNIHLNGSYHCSLRYSQLLAFYNELKQNFDISSLEDFPPKHLFSLNEHQLYCRRKALEKYLHSVCQDRVISHSDMLREFLLAAQKASSEMVQQSSHLEVFLVNGKSVTVTASVSEHSDELLEKAVVEVGLEADLTYFFALFLEEQEDGHSWILIRTLQDAESPCLTLEVLNKFSPHRVTLRRNFWSPSFVDLLLSDRVAKNLLYIETMSEVESGELIVSDYVKESLASLQKKALKKEYLEVAKTIPEFCYRQMDGISFDYPKKGLYGSVRVGCREIVTIAKEGGKSTNSWQYPLTRIRCWKVGYKQDTGEQWLGFNFQVGKDDFVWVTLIGKLAPFVSLSLHSTIAELLRCRNTQPIRKPSENPIRRKPRSLPPVKFCDPESKYRVRSLSLSSASASASADKTEGKDEKTRSLGGSEEQPSHSQRDMESGSYKSSKDSPTLSSSHNSDSAKHTADPRRLSEASNSSASSTGDSPRSPRQSAELKPASKNAKPAPPAPKGKMSSGGSTENPTFQFGTDDDL